MCAKIMHIKSKKGFTIIEVLIVLGIAGLILVSMLLAVPTLQKRQRNHERDSDARLIYAAISECLANNRNQTSRCTTPESLNLDPSSLSIFTGFHYGATDPSESAWVSPTENEPNWLFRLRCNSTGTWFLDRDTSAAHSYAVTYIVEGGPNRCID